MSRFPIRARVLKRADYWLLILPSGRRVVYGRWWLAMHYANEAVAKEREYERLKDTGLGPRMARKVAPVEVDPFW